MSIHTSDISASNLEHYYMAKKPLANNLLRQLITQKSLFALPEDLSEKEHSTKLDKILGYKIRQVEQGLLSQYQAFYLREECKRGKKQYQGTQAWIGLHPQTLQTPYNQILDVFELLAKENIERIVDLGAAYGRVGLIAKAVFPNCQFLGHEVIEARVEEGKRLYRELGLEGCELEAKNILDDDFIVPDADLYFIYDFSNPSDIKKILRQLDEKIYSERFYLVARGKGIRSLIQLKFPGFWAAHGAIHHGEWSLYSSFKDLN